MSKRIKNAPGMMKLCARHVGTRAKAMGNGAGGPDLGLGMGRMGRSAPQDTSKLAHPKSAPGSAINSQKSLKVLFLSLSCFFSINSSRGRAI